MSAFISQFPENGPNVLNDELDHYFVTMNISQIPPFTHPAFSMAIDLHFIMVQSSN